MSPRLLSESERASEPTYAKKKKVWGCTCTEVRDKTGRRVIWIQVQRSHPRLSLSVFISRPRHLCYVLASFLQALPWGLATMRDAIQGQQDTLPFHLQDGQILPSLAWPLVSNQLLQATLCFLIVYPIMKVCKPSLLDISVTLLKSCLQNAFRGSQAVCMGET